MNDPFNPGRFIYETRSQSDLGNTTVGRSKKPVGRTETFSTTRAGPGSPVESSPRLMAKTRANLVHPEATKIVDGGQDRTYCRILIGLCALLVAVSSIALGRAIERSALHSPSSGGISPDVRAYVDQAVLRLSRDPVGRPDFALYAHGARVIRDLTGVLRGDTLVLPWMDSSPNISLTDDIRVGSCWKFPDEAGQLGFRTSEMLFPTQVTVDHLPFDIAADIGQAPRKMVLWGALDGGSNTESFRVISESGNLSSRIPPHVGRTEPSFTANLTFVILATFEYDIYSPNNVQTFSLDPAIIDASISFGVFILDILSNWGSDVTCLYRVRVHGECVFQ